MSSTLKSVRKATPETPLLENSSPEKITPQNCPLGKNPPGKNSLIFFKKFFFSISYPLWNKLSSRIKERTFDLQEINFSFLIWFEIMVLHALLLYWVGHGLSCETFTFSKVLLVKCKTWETFHWVRGWRGGSLQIFTMWAVIITVRLLDSRHPK